ncbi:MAG: hypothetical protein LBH60_06765 [Prevotellaceae bacterium]|nr:hypothetical protein [Prevotellaceae bacterium]
MFVNYVPSGDHKGRPLQSTTIIIVRNQYQGNRIYLRRVAQRSLPPYCKAAFLRIERGWYVSNPHTFLSFQDVNSC